MRSLLFILSFFVFHTGIAQNSIPIEEMEKVFPKSVLKCKLNQDLQIAELEVKTEQIINVTALYSNMHRTIEIEWLQFTNPGPLYKEAILPLNKQDESQSETKYSKKVNWNGRQGVLEVNASTKLYTVLFNWDGVNVLTITFDGCSGEEEIRKAYDSLQWGEKE